MAVEIDANTVYEPDVVVRCGTPLPDKALKLSDPIILVEVRSPWSGGRDAGAKLEDHFRLPSVRHYLIVKTENRSVIHHVRDAAGAITTRIVRDGRIVLDPRASSCATSSGRCRIRASPVSGWASSM